MTPEEFESLDDDDQARTGMWLLRYRFSTYLVFAHVARLAKVDGDWDALITSGEAMQADQAIRDMPSAEELRWEFPDVSHRTS